MKGKIFVITGTSGSGKSTLASAVLEDYEMNIAKVTTCTTRDPRGEERNGIDYNFLSRAEFENFIEKDALFEHAEVYGNYYGSLRKDVNALLDSGKNVLFVIDVQGAETLENINKEIVTIFVRTPSILELRKRIEKRAEDSVEKIEQRLSIAKKEEEKAPLFDYIIINDILDTAITELKSIIKQNL